MTLASRRAPFMLAADMALPASEATHLIGRMHAGDARAADELFPLVYAELRRLAERMLGARAGAQTLQATALVHEAYVKLVDRDAPLDWNSREHFVRVAARAMRQVLVDRARSRASRDRAHASRGDLALDAIEAQFGANLPDLLDLEAALQRLEALDPELARIAELRFFGGLSVEDTARALGASVRTVERAWTTAKLWLKAELE